jgi:uncharacterized protein YukE
MSDPQTFADLLEQFNEKYAKFQDDFWKGFDDIVDMLNDAAGSIGGKLSFLPVVGDDIEDAIKKWNDEICPALLKAMEEIQEKIQEAVNKLAGNPADLQIWAENYVEAQGLIFKQRNEVEVAKDVEGAWEGDAFDKYSAVSEVQFAAIQQLADALEEGGKLTSDAAHKIIELWRKLLFEFASYGTDILEILSSATDASKVLSFEVPVILEACAKVWQKIVNITDILLEFMTSQATTDSINWKALAVSAGGLPNNEWPSISEGASDTMNNPGNWGAQ